MEIICKSCNLKYQSKPSSRCPRCNTINNMMKKCEDCKGCGFFKKNKNVVCDINNDSGK